MIKRCSLLSIAGRAPHPPRGRPPLGGASAAPSSARGCQEEKEAGAIMIVAVVVGEAMPMPVIMVVAEDPLQHAGDIEAKPQDAQADAQHAGGVVDRPGQGRRGDASAREHPVPSCQATHGQRRDDKKHGHKDAHLVCGVVLEEDDANEARRAGTALDETDEHRADLAVAPSGSLDALRITWRLGAAMAVAMAVAVAVLVAVPREGDRLLRGHEMRVARARLVLRAPLTIEVLVHAEEEVGATQHKQDTDDVVAIVLVRLQRLPFEAGIEDREDEADDGVLLVLSGTYFLL